MNAQPLTVYKASAGSGKTFTLAVQYIKLLVLAEEGGGYAHILGVTFTNKATTEMKERIVAMLYGIANGSTEAYYHALRASLQGEPNAPDTDDELRRRCRVALFQILHDYSRFRIQTIDAFFQSVLRGLAHELGLTANLQVEISDDEVLSKAVDRIVDRLENEPVVLDWLMSLVRDQINNNQRWDVTRRVKEFGRAIFNEEFLRRGDELRRVLSDDDAVRHYIRRLEQMSYDAVAQIRQYGEQLENVLHNNGVQCADFSNGARTLAPLIERLNSGQIEMLEVLSTYQKWADNPLSLVKKADVTTRPDLLEAADIICEIMGEYVTQLPQLQYIFNSARQALAHIKPLRLLAFIDREVAEINSETSRFNLAKTPILLNRMVGKDDAPFVFEKMGALLHHVMIDEFQDTSRLQWENFKVLLLESFSRGGHNLVVGDVKQSIYRFRGGDWRMLGGIEKEMYPEPDIITLDTNYRSQRRVVCFNNKFFRSAVELLDGVSADEEQMMNGEFSFAKAYSDLEQLVPENRAENGFVRVNLLDSNEYKSRETWESIIVEDLIDQVRQLHASGLGYQQMTILVRNNFETAPIIKAFAAEEDLPPIVSDEAFLLEASPAVNLLIAALRVIGEPQHAVAECFLKQNNVELTEEECSKLRLMPIYELLETLYRRLNLASFTGQDAYLFGFFDAVTDYLHGEAADITSFLKYWDEKLHRQSIPAGQINGIRIMSVHKSKGLEFHTVLLPFCTWEFERDRLSSLMWCEPTEEPFSDIPLLPITPTANITPNSIFAKDYAQEHLLARLDELNTLYVALTRACSNLYLWAVGGDLERAGRTVGDLISAVMTAEVPIIKDIKVEEPCQDNPFTTYIFGEPDLQVELKREGSRMMPLRKPVDVTMQSNALNVNFRQSNRSHDFLHQLNDEPAPNEAEDQFALAEQSRQQHYLETGRLLHAVLQHIRTAADIESVLSKYEREGVISRSLPDGSLITIRRCDAEKWLHRGLAHPQVADWFSGAWKLFNECSIVQLDTDGTTCVNRPDRVMLSDDGSKAVVVDFKFESPKTPRLQDNREQVKNYMNLIQQMYPEAEVEGYLWFVYAGLVMPV